MSTLQRWGTKLTSGGMTDTDYTNMMNVLTASKKAAASQYRDSAGRHITQYSRRTGKNPSDSAYDLGIEMPTSGEESGDTSAAGSSSQDPLQAEMKKRGLLK